MAEKLIQIKINNEQDGALNKVVKVGDVFQLANLVEAGIDFYKREDKDGALFLETSSKNFSHVYHFYKKIENFKIKKAKKLHRLFSNSIFKITDILKIEEQIFICSKHLIIDLYSGLNTKELILIESKKGEFDLNSSREIQLLENLNYVMELWDDKLVTKEEANQSTVVHYQHYMAAQNKWPVDFIFRIDGKVTDL